MSVEDDGDMLFCFDYLMIKYPTAVTGQAICSCSFYANTNYNIIDKTMSAW